MIFNGKNKEKEIRRSFTPRGKYFSFLGKIFYYDPIEVLTKMKSFNNTLHCKKMELNCFYFIENGISL